MPWIFNMFSPAIFKIHQGFSWSAGAQWGGWAQADRMLDCRAAVQSACACSCGRPAGIFPDFQLGPEVPCSETVPSINTYFHSSSTVSVFQSNALKNQNASCYFSRRYLTEMWDQKSMLQPEPYVCKACGFSISHCINCVELVSLPRCPHPSLKHLLSASLVFYRADWLMISLLFFQPFAGCLLNMHLH